MQNAGNTHEARTRLIPRSERKAKDKAQDLVQQSDCAAYHHEHCQMRDGGALAIVEAAKDECVNDWGREQDQLVARWSTLEDSLRRESLDGRGS